MHGHSGKLRAPKLRQRVDSETIALTGAPTIMRKYKLKDKWYIEVGRGQKIAA